MAYRFFHDSNRIISIFIVRCEVANTIWREWKGKEIWKDRICDSLLLDTRQWITAERLLNDFVKSIKRSPDRVYARLHGSACRDCGIDKHKCLQLVTMKWKPIELISALSLNKISNKLPFAFKTDLFELIREISIDGKMYSLLKWINFNFPAREFLNYFLFD